MRCPSPRVGITPGSDAGRVNASGKINSGAEQIRLAYQRGRQVYGSPRIHAELRDQGLRCGKNRVARLMRENGLRVVYKRRHVKTTDSQHALPVAPNLLQRDFNAEAPNRKWLADITDVWTGEGWLYLAVIPDVYSRLIVGWAMDSHRDEPLTERALLMALGRRQPADELLHHSDRGSQYTSHDYQALLAQAGIVVSMRGKGNCYDHAMMESFISSLKTECVHRQSFQSRSEAKQVIFEWIEVMHLLLIEGLTLLGSDASFCHPEPHAVVLPWRVALLAHALTGTSAPH